MHIPRYTLLFIFVCYGIITRSQGYIKNNPLLIHSNAPIAFDKVNATIIREATQAVIKLTDARIGKISTIPANQHTTTNTLMALDELLYEPTDLSMKLGLISQTYGDDSVRNAANAASEKLSVYLIDLFLNEGLYKSLKAFDKAASAKTLPSNKQKFLKDALLAFEKNGMKLDPEKRETLKVINNKLVVLGVAFDKNISEYKDSLEFTEDQLTGVPDNIRSPWKRGAGKFVVYVNGPNSNNISRYADQRETRRRMFVAYMNRAYPENLKVLDSLFYYRQQFAATLGFRSYGAYGVVDKMAASPSKVWAFENDLITKLTPYVTSDLLELKQLKQQLHPSLSDTLYEYDVNYYIKKLLDNKYQLNTDEVKQYFEMNNTLEGMFSVYKKLFALDIKPASNIATWHPQVKTFDMYADGKKVGTFYLDLFPRPNKYTHFACFPISQYSKTGKVEVLPTAALVCNFPEGNTNEPSLLNHQDVVTLFHEFGHLVHCLLARSDVATQGLSGIKGDFIEAPSQFLENWCWEYDALKMFARHYKTGEPMPRDLFDKMKKTELVQNGTYTIRQIYFGVLDFTYHDKYDSIKGMDMLKISKDLSALRQLPFTEGAHFICNFGHLNGYAANYYGYLWSEVFAKDMFSAFKKNGVMDVSTGLKYRREVLEKGAAVDEMQMLRNFLGRQPNTDAFFESMGLKQEQSLK